MAIFLLKKEASIYLLFGLRKLGKIILLLKSLFSLFRRSEVEIGFMQFLNMAEPSQDHRFLLSGLRMALVGPGVERWAHRNGLEMGLDAPPETGQPGLSLCLSELDPPPGSDDH